MHDEAVSHSGGELVGLRQHPAVIAEYEVRGEGQCHVG
jgi:hypothetical protein